MKSLSKSLISLLASTIILSSTNVIRSQTMAAGGAHSVFVCSNGKARATGNNVLGQLGTGTTISTSVPTPVDSLSGIVATTARDQFTLFLLNDSTVWATGYNGYGQFGNGTIVGSDSAIQIPGLTGIIKIAAGFYHSLFLKSDSTVWSCGRNFSGELGDGTKIQSSIPVKVASLSGVIDIAAGDYHSMFLLSDSTVWSCGDNQNGCLGLGSSAPIQVLNPTKVSSISGVKLIAGGFRHSLFVKHDGTAWASGYNNNGQQGNGTNTENFTPTQISNFSNIIDISAGQYHSLFLKNDGTAWACGSNGAGQLGNGTTTDQNTPIQVSNITGITKVVASGYYHSLFLKNDNTFWSCGANNVGQLGDGTYTPRITPTLVMDSCAATNNIFEISNSFKANVYPNPSSGLFNLEIPEGVSSEGNIEIYTTLGEVIYSTNVANSKHAINLSAQPKGIYFYTLKNNNQIAVTGKVLIQ